MQMRKRKRWMKKSIWYMRDCYTGTTILIGLHSKPSIIRNILN